MFRALERWVNELEDREETLGALTKVRSVSVHAKGQGLTPSLQERVRSGKNKRKGSDDDDTPGTQGGAYPQSQKTYRSGDQPYAGSTQASSQSGGYGRQESRYEQTSSASLGGFVSKHHADPGRHEASHRGSGYSQGQGQGQTDYGRSRVDERQTQPWDAGATYGQSSRDNFTRRDEPRDYDNPRQTSYTRDESYDEGRTQRSDVYQQPHGHQQPHGYTRPDESRNTNEEQSYGRGGSRGEDYSYGRREEERRSGADYSERPQRYGEDQPYRAPQFEGRPGQSGLDYSGSDDYSERRQEYDGRASSQIRGDEYSGGDSYSERQASYGGREYGRSGGGGGGGYDDSSRRGQYGAAEDEGFGSRSGGYARNRESEDTFGAERLNLNEGEGEGTRGYSRRYGDYEQEGGYQGPGAEY